MEAYLAASLGWGSHMEDGNVTLNIVHILCSSIGHRPPLPPLVGVGR